MGIITRAITDTGVVRALTIDGTDIVSRAREIHLSTPVATAALGRTLMAASLMGSMLKSENETLTLRIAGDGPIGKLIACSDCSGNVRGMAANPGVGLPLRDDGKLDVGCAVGRNGYLAVTKDFGTKEPYISQVPLVSGEIAEDVTSYFAVSEQTGTACALGVLVGGNGEVRAAGGYMIQLLPNVYADEIARLEENMRNAPPITSMMARDLSPIDILRAVTDGFNFEILDSYEVHYACGCSVLRVEKALISLGMEELSGLQAELREKGEEYMEVGCEFCDKKYKARFINGNITVT